MEKGEGGGGLKDKLVHRIRTFSSASATVRKIDMAALSAQRLCIIV